MKSTGLMIRAFVCSDCLIQLIHRINDSDCAGFLTCLRSKSPCDCDAWYLQGIGTFDVIDCIADHDSFVFCSDFIKQVAENSFFCLSFHQRIQAL